MNAINIATDAMVIVVLPSTINVIADVYGENPEELIRLANAGKVFYVTNETRSIDYEELEEFYEILADEGEPFKPTFLIRRG